MMANGSRRDRAPPMFSQDLKEVQDHYDIQGGILMIDFTVMWQPILRPNRIPRAKPFDIVAAQLQLHPYSGADRDTWRQGRVDEGAGTYIQGVLEYSLTPLIRQMAHAPQWHIPLHPDIPPTTREWLPFWNETRAGLNLVYELPVDREISDWVWNEIELVRRTPHYGQRPPLVVGTHVGRGGLSDDLAFALNESPFKAILLDPSVLRGMTNVGGDVANDRRIDALTHFLAQLRQDLPVVATGITEWPEWQIASALGMKFGQGTVWMAPTPLNETFGDDPHFADVDAKLGLQGYGFDPQAPSDDFDLGLGWMGIV